jgi:hypothetical protein
MKIKNKHLRTLSELLSQKHPAKMSAGESYDLCMLAADVKQHAQVLDETKMQIASSKFPSKQKDAQPGQLDPQDVQPFYDAVKPIMETEIDVYDVKPMSFETVNEFSLSPMELAELIEIGLLQKK